MPRRAKLELDVRRVPSCHRDRHDGAELGTAVEDPDTRHPREAAASIVRQLPGAIPRGIQPDLKRILSRGAESEHQGVGELPGLEPARVRGELERVGIGPGSAVHVHQEWVGPGLRALDRTRRGSPALEAPAGTSGRRP